jgi:uncharacterized membrane protein YdbT with pleckstrin-like domain
MSRNEPDNLFDDLKQPGGSDFPEEPAFPEESGLEGLGDFGSGGEASAEFGNFGKSAGPEGEAVADYAMKSFEKLSEEAPAAEEVKEEEEEARPSFWERLTQTSPYVVMLGLSLLALMIGTVILVIELARYNFELKPPG